MRTASAAICPLCDAALDSFVPRCPHCRGDLGGIARVLELGDCYFNRAVLHAREGLWAPAAEHLAVALAVHPEDVEALVLLGKVRYHQHDDAGALAAWRAAARLRQDEGIADLLRRAETMAGTADRTPPDHARPAAGKPRRPAAKKRRR